MTSMNISLPDPMRAYVQTRVNEGQYASSSDYVRDLIRRDQKRSEKIAAMQVAISEGLESGVSDTFSMDKLQAELDRQA